MSADDAKERLLHAAGPVFAAKGYDAATVREICESAGVNLASVNYHFGDKQSLYIEAVRRARETRAKQIPYPVRGEEVSAEQLFRDFVLTMFRRMLGSDRVPWQSQLMMREILQPTDACREMVEEYFRPQFERLLELINQLTDGGQPKHRVRQLGFSVIGQCLYYRVAGTVVELLTPAEEHESEFGLEQLAAHVSDTMLAAFNDLKLGRSALPIAGKYPSAVSAPDERTSS